MGNIIPYAISDEDIVSSETQKQTRPFNKKPDVCFLTVPSIPYPGDKALIQDSSFGSNGIPETMDLRPLIEVPYNTTHPCYMKHRANIEVVARQLECMAAACGAWKGRVSRKFWEAVNPRTLTSIRDIYDCVKKYGMIPYSQENTLESPSTKISARPYRLLVVKMLPRNVFIWQQFLSSQCPIIISLAMYTNQPMSVYEPPQSDDVLRMVIPALVVGYDSKRDIFIIQGPFDNSWGEDGYIALPYECIENQSIVLEMWVAKFSKNMRRFESKVDFDTISFDVTTNDH